LRHSVPLVLLLVGCQEFGGGQLEVFSRNTTMEIGTSSALGVAFIPEATEGRTDAPIAFELENVPVGVSAVWDPEPVGIEPGILRLAVDAAALPGPAEFDVRAVGSGWDQVGVVPLQVLDASAPDFVLDVDQTQLGAEGTVMLSVQRTGDWAEPVGLRCDTPELSCTFSDEVDGVVEVQMSLSQPIGPMIVAIEGESGTYRKTVNLIMDGS
jgi:hypothetical protein